MITMRFRRNYAKLSLAEQEAFNQVDINLKQLLNMDLDHVYTVEDLGTQALALIPGTVWAGTDRYSRLSPFINYDKLITCQFGQDNSAKDATG
jgi:hypothetical protein